MPLFRREAKISKVEPVKAEKPTEQPVQSPTPAPEKHETEIPEELKPLAQKWRENLRVMANARFTPAIMVNEQAFYVLQNLPANFDSKTGVTTVTVRAIGEDMRIYEVSQKIHMDKFGRVLMLGNEVKLVEKPADFGISADVVLKIIKSVAEGSNPIPLEFGF
jgi:hypothetical protein